MKKNKEENLVKCKYCGYKIDKDKLKEHEEKYCDQNPKATNPVKGDKKEEGLLGVSGWLFFFVITIMILSPIYSLFLLFEEPFMTTFNYVEGLGMISTLILAGIFLINKKYYAVTFAKIVLISMGINAIIYIFIGDYSISRTLVYSIIWFWYLSVSKRVKITYGKIKEPKKGKFIWPTLSIIYAFLSPLSGLLFSIVSLRKISKNRKLNGLGLSIIALIISIIVIIYFLFAGAFSSYVPEEVDLECNNYCYYLGGASTYIILPTVNSEIYNCVCTDSKGNEISSKEIHS